MQEIWKDIKDYEGYYQVSNLGNILSLNYHRMNISKQKQFTQNHKGYLTVHLCKDTKQKRFLVHRLVAEAFIPNPQNKPQVNHIDGNKQNNNVKNLEWCNNSENQKHAINTGLKKIKIGCEVFNHKQVNQYDINGNFIKKWLCINDASRNLNIIQTSIVKCCKGFYKTAGGFIWRYANK